MMESDGYGSPWGGEAGKKDGKKLHRKYYNHLTADVHYQKGMVCIDCHASRKAIGLGTGIYSAKADGIDIPFELERIVDENGRQIQATSHYGARPFNKEELGKMMRVNVCMSCHDFTKEEAIWKKITDITGFAKTNAKHNEILKKVFEKETSK